MSNGNYSSSFGARQRKESRSPSARRIRHLIAAGLSARAYVSLGLSFFLFPVASSAVYFFSYPRFSYFSRRTTRERDAFSGLPRTVDHVFTADRRRARSSNFSVTYPRARSIALRAREARGRDLKGLSEMARAKRRSTTRHAAQSRTV